MSARVLVAYAASTGFTSGQAAEVGGQIAAVGDLEVDVRPIASVPSVEQYTAVYLGWSGHSRAGRRETLRFLTRNAAALLSTRVWVVHHQPTPEGAPSLNSGPVRLSRLLLREGVPATAYEAGLAAPAAETVSVAASAAAEHPALV